MLCSIKHVRQSRSEVKTLVAHRSTQCPVMCELTVVVERGAETQARAMASADGKDECVKNDNKQPPNARLDDTHNPG